MVPRLTTTLLDPETWPLGKFWQDATVALPDEAPDRWQNIFTGEELAVNYASGNKFLQVELVLGNFPVALLAAPRT